MNRLAAEDPIRAALTRDDPVAVELIWDRYAAGLFAFLAGTLCSKHDAEDVLQAVFVRIVRKRRHLAKARCLDAYVCGIARNEAVSFLRRRRRKPVATLEDDAWLTAPDSGKPGAELIEELQAALTRLPQAQREVVVLKVYQDKTFREIAKLLDVSLNTAASRYRYAMERLRTLLKESSL